jgi:hypothetical protein
MENLIIFINYSHSIPTVLGLFGKENLEYISEFNEKTFRDTTVQIYYHKKLNAKIYLYHNENAFLNQSIEFFNQFNNKLILYLLLINVKYSCVIMDILPKQPFHNFLLL